MLSSNKNLSLFVLSGLSSVSAFGQEAEVVSQPSQSWIEKTGLPSDPILIALLAAIIVLFVVAIYLKSTYTSLYREIFGKEPLPVQKEISLKKVVSIMNESVPVEEEHSILTDHEYDGIRELDNNLPLWWRYMFYGTIIFSFVYLFKFHVFKTGELQLEEYQKEVASAEIMKEENRKKDAANVDEKSVVYLEDAAAIASGKTIFNDNCRACHGGAGEGGVGPNLADEYWLHGGGISNVFKTIKYGVPDKGMIAWQAQLKPKQIQEVASYILTLKGTNPPNAKAAQGEIYKEDAAFKDSLATDSVKVALK